MLPLIPALLLLLLNGPAQRGVPVADGYLTAGQQASYLSRLGSPVSFAISLLAASEAATFPDARASLASAPDVAESERSRPYDLEETRIEALPGQAEHSRDGPR